MLGLEHSRLFKVRYWVDTCLAGIAMVAVTVALCPASEAQRAGGPDEARSQCQSEDTNKRLIGCTIVINAKGFGSKFELAAALDGRCWAFNDLQQYERGLADCKASIVLQPRYSYAYQNLGNSLVGLGDVPSGIAAFTKSIELKPDFIYSYFSRGKAFAALGNKGMAKKDFEHALTIDPTSQEAKDAIASLDDPPPPTRNEQQPKPAPQTETTNSGTGFFVSFPGYVLTNEHVVDGCRTASLSRPGFSTSEARIVASDSANDLALLMTDIGTKTVPTFRVGARVGESIFVYGFPLTGLLSSSGNFTVGTITSIAGLGDDSRIMQISAPVQPGNSGGPLLDRSGNVVGIIVSKLNALRLAQVTQDMAQNINFAIKASIAANFLEVNNIQTRVGSNAEMLEATEIAERAKQFTVEVTCKPRR
jgi:S1-C subfamily serine protease